MKLPHLLFGLGCLAALGSSLNAQQIPDLNVDGHTVQIHGFVSQGFAGTNENNFLTMDTSHGSFAMTDFAVNASTSLSDKLRVSAQMYDYNVGKLGNWEPTLDFGYLDYKVKDWFGIRAGKVKTVLGLYNDTQDANFLYTWALMPQSIYPLDLRASSIAHLGGDIYGHAGLKKAGSLDYTAYYGYVPIDKNGGSYFSTVSSGSPETNQRQVSGGGDVRWNTPVPGLLVGTSLTLSNAAGYGNASTPYGIFPYNFTENGMRTFSSYADYVKGKWHLSGEFRRYHAITVSAGNDSDQSTKAFFAAASYRLAKHLEFGEYTSRIGMDHSMAPSDPNSKHIFDQAITARIDVTSYWNFKVEGHFMNGYGDTYSARGFYAPLNPNGVKPDTNMVIVRTGFNF